MDGGLRAWVARAWSTSVLWRGSPAASSATGCGRGGSPRWSVVRPVWMGARARKSGWVLPRARKGIEYVLDGCFPGFLPLYFYFGVFRRAMVRASEPDEPVYCQ
eukprot:scaffold33410_cov26-Tisochrysis_lutea.AAC.1